MTEKATVDKRFIVNLQDKDFVTYEGLLDAAHQCGLVAIKTEAIQLPDESSPRCIMKATAKTENGEFDGYGDADPSNVNRMITKHIIRMAETRAKARALRDLTNIGMTAIEELGENEGHTKEAKRVPIPKRLDEKTQLINTVIGIGKDKGITRKGLDKIVAGRNKPGQQKLEDLSMDELSKFVDFLNQYEPEGA